MGLDMYLKASRYVSGYEHSTRAEKKLFKTIVSDMEIDPKIIDNESPSLTVDVTVMYWRKVNSIHNWFVENCQDGRDECQDTCVSRKSLKELQKLCEETYKTKDAKTLKSVSGPFFGSQEIDWEDIQATATRLKEILSDKSLENCIFIYHSSW
jgi:hypothetical protein